MYDHSIHLMHVLSLAKQLSLFLLYDVAACSGVLQFLFFVRALVYIGEAKNRSLTFPVQFLDIFLQCTLCTCSEFRGIPCNR